MKKHSLKTQFIKYLIGTFAFFSFLYASLLLFEFSDPISHDDYFYADKIIKEYSIDTLGIHLSYNSQLKFITEVQAAVVSLSKVGEGIPMCHSRNIKDLYLSQMGLCYDNSHVIEKILAIYGFKTRHVSMYLYKGKLEWLYVFFKLNSFSHAVSEVKTSMGWMFLDSLSDFKGVSADLKPLNLSEVRKLIYLKKVETKILLNGNYSSKFIFFYGVYSRNGKLYYPYNWIPDYKTRELLYNLEFQ